MNNTNFNDLNFNDSNGKKVENKLEYINSLQDNITFSEKLSVKKKKKHQDLSEAAKQL